VKQVRLLNKLKSKELAQLIGVSAIHMSYMENGKNKFTLDVLMRTCSVLKISLSDIFLLYEINLLDTAEET
jgi:DNA-binding Xre family transcriptional regulator